MHIFPLTQNWQFKQRAPSLPLDKDFASSDGWLPATVPGVVHQDLFAAGRIPDPFIGMNEKSVQWVGECDWLYRCTFDLPASLDLENVDLCFDGLDTFAIIWINGERILTSDNMFIPQRVSVKSRLKESQNEIHILFESAWKRGKERETIHGQMKVWNTDPSRVYVRKMQCQYGWDWSPFLVTAGIWRSSHLDFYNSRISDMHCLVVVAEDLKSAILTVNLQVQAVKRRNLNLHLTLYDPAGNMVSEAVIPAVNVELKHAFSINPPQLWWPHGYGGQPLYRILVSLTQGDQVLDEQEQRLGLRRARLIQEPLPDETGTTFYFEINGTPIFCGGANWVPADSFIPRLKPEDYRSWLKLAADANMNMIRIWGGGIYEEDIFYDTCDELGLMVWQDFMFSCAIYPTPEWFLNSVRAEVIANVRRLRHHPCLVIWCGNNEDYTIARSFNLYDPDFNDNFNNTSFPAREIYERLLPQVCNQLDPDRPYWRGSPYNGTTGKDDLIRGDNHSWKIWFDLLADHHDFPQIGGRFVSEFGVQAYPHRLTLASFASPEDLKPHSQTIEYHDKAPGAPQRLAAYLAANVPLPSSDIDMYIYATQFIQAETLAEAYRAWRRNWGGPRHYSTSGALVWQLNDCWPAISWSVIDYYRRPKPAYYVTRRALAPIVVELAPTGSGAAVYAVNNSSQSISADLEVRGFALDGEKVFSEVRQVVLLPNQCTELGIFTHLSKVPTVISARLVSAKIILCRGALWPEPFKYFHLHDPQLSISSIGEHTMRIEAIRPAKGVWLWAEEDLTMVDGIEWGDNMLDIMPDDPHTLTVDGLKGEIKYRDLSCLYK